MARARVELVDSLSHTRGGRKFVKGQPQTLTNAAEILYYKSQSSFSVTMEDAPKAKAKSPSKGAGDDAQAGAETEDAGYTEESLGKLKKAELVEVADEMELLLEGNEKKSEMIEAILEAQKG